MLIERVDGQGSFFHYMRINFYTWNKPLPSNGSIGCLSAVSSEFEREIPDS
ncbi:hypothetical protein [Paenibacillus contaminans]|uniref:hypothetical protein n=1 Tax=Paenibacillus contaminans TaxID=450362 RepID=UPI001313F3B2|nr:hypothetical protein [Paenibacillus contaminans]